MAGIVAPAHRAHARELHHTAGRNPRKAYSSVDRRPSEINRKASKKLLLPAPFGPTRSVTRPKRTSQAAILL
jgi:hypothetical protein